NLGDRLPTIPVPLLPSDKDASISLQRAFEECYTEAAYDLSIDYTKMPPLPPFSKIEQEWLSKQLEK
ncbi:MAG: DUF4058 family protein, partial [Bacteroidota bacterium]